MQHNRRWWKLANDARAILSPPLSFAREMQRGSEKSRTRKRRSGRRRRARENRISPTPERESLSRLSVCASAALPSSTSFHLLPRFPSLSLFFVLSFAVFSFLYAALLIHVPSPDFFFFLILHTYMYYVYIYIYIQYLCTKLERKKDENTGREPEENSNDISLFVGAPLVALASVSPPSSRRIDGGARGSVLIVLGNPMSDIPTDDRSIGKVLLSSPTRFSPFVFVFIVFPSYAFFVGTASDGSSLPALDPFDLSLLLARRKCGVSTARSPHLASYPFTSERPTLRYPPYDRAVSRCHLSGRRSFVKRVTRPFTKTPTAEPRVP